MKHIRTILSFVAALFVSLTMSAQQISESEAKSRAMQFFSKNSTRYKTKRKVGQQQAIQTYKASSVINCDTFDLQGAEPFYVVQSSGEGFVIVGGDERMESILAYSDDGVFDTENIPDQVSGWLTRYAKEMKVLSSVKVQASDEFFQLRDEMAYSLPIKSGGVSPLLGNVRWGQEEPFNNMCPLDGSSRSLTGCVATSCAQIMRYYKYPERGIGSKTYYWGGNIIADYSQSVYDWDNMLDTYDGEYTTEQANAVAKLMYDVGIALDMIYSSIASASYNFHIVEEFPKHLGYDKDVAVVFKNNMYELDWHRVILNQLNDNHPVEYEGGEHSFVLDGYNTPSDSDVPYYHMNFGWSNKEKNYDGYYLLSSIRPKYTENGQDVYGGWDFSEIEHITCNFYPEDGKDGDAYISVTPSPSLPEYILYKGEQTRKVSVKFENIAYATKAFEGKIALYAKNTDGDAYQLTEPISVKIDPESSVDYESIDITFPSNMAPGLYYYDWVYVWNGNEMSPDADGLLKENKKMLYVYEDVPEMVVLDISQSSNPINPSEHFEMDITVENNSSEDYYGPIYAIFTQPSTGVVDTLKSEVCYIPGNSQETININGCFTNLAPSDVSIKFVCEPESNLMQNWGYATCRVLPFTTNLTVISLIPLESQDVNKFTLKIYNSNNFLDVPFEGDLQMLLVDEYDNEICQFGPLCHIPNSSTPMITHKEVEGYSYHGWESYELTSSLPSGLPEGGYRIYVVASQQNSGTWQRMKKQNISSETLEELYVPFTLEGTDVTFSNRTHITYESTSPNYAFNYIIVNSTGNGRVVRDEKEMVDSEDRALVWQGEDYTIDVIPDDYAYAVVTIDGEPYETPVDGGSLVISDVQAGHTVNVTFNHPSGDTNGDGFVDVEDVANLVAKLEREDNYTVDLDLNLNNKLDKEDVELMVEMDLTGKGIEIVRKKWKVYHECVDLGLSVKWATMNVEATEVAGSKINPHTGQLDCYGEYFAWGETSPKDSYLFAGLKYNSGTTWNGPYTKYVVSSDVGTIDNNTILDPEDDAAHVNWGGEWRMPTYEEMYELYRNCYWEWIESYNDSGVKGYMVYKVKDDSDKGKMNNTGNYSKTPTASYSLSDTHIFLPVAGQRIGSSISSVGSQGEYWTSSLDDYDSREAWNLTFTTYNRNNTTDYRCIGKSIRPVCP